MEYRSVFTELSSKSPEELRSFVLAKQHEMREYGRVFAEWYYQGDFWLEAIKELDREDLKELQKVIGNIDGWLCDYLTARKFIEQKARERRRYANGI